MIAVTKIHGAGECTTYSSKSEIGTKRRSQFNGWGEREIDVGGCGQTDALIRGQNVTLQGSCEQGVFDARG